MMRWIGSCRPSHVRKLHDKDVRPRDFASQQAQHLAQAMLVKLLHRLALEPGTAIVDHRDLTAAGQGRPDPFPVRLIPNGE